MREKLWVTNPLPDENALGAQVVWESPTAEELLDNAKDGGYVVRGPYVLEAEVERLRSKLDLAREGLSYVLAHHVMAECLCGAGRVTAESALRLSDPAGGDSGGVASS